MSEHPRTATKSTSCVHEVAARIGQSYPHVKKQQGHFKILCPNTPELLQSQPVVLHWDSTTADTHNEKLSLNYRSINKQPRSLNFSTPLAYIQKLYNLQT